jgi:hypothetical protein
VFKLSDENRATGTMPQLGGVRKCSQKAKGAPQDMWRANEFGDRQYFHAIGFNRDEYSRIKRDKVYSMGGRRIATYPIYEWWWTRQDCIDYLKRELKVDWSWPKSCCRHCPFAGCNTAGWPEQLARFIALPDEAAQHVIDEYVCLALNPRSRTVRPRQVADHSAATRPRDRGGQTGRSPHEDYAVGGVPRAAVLLNTGFRDEVH